MTSASPQGQCPSTGCKEPGDPFCPRHFERMPYAIHLLGEIAEQDEEVAKAKAGRWQEIDVQGPAAQEFLSVVRRRGEVSLRRAGLNCFKSAEAGESYMRALRQAGLMRTKRSPRGTVILYLPKGAN